MITNPLAPGLVRFAEYHEQFVPEFRGSPFLETLPEVMEPEEMRQVMLERPKEYNFEAVRTLSPAKRRLLAGGILYYRDAVGIHTELAARLTNLLRWGYVARNPIHPAFQAATQARERSLRVTGTGEDLFVSAAPLPQQYWPTATGLTLLGITGIGKTVAVEAWMKLYPQLYVHTEYQGRAFTHTQVTYLRLQCPRNGSLHDLIENFFQSMDALHYSVPIDTGYRDAYKKGRRTIQELIPDMARLASQHGLGLLILDEVQDLAPRGAPAILSFLVQMVNTIGVPIVLVGGLEALPLLTEQFRQARRGQTEGDMIIGRAEEGPDFRAFCERLWEFQYTLERTPLTDAIVDALYDGAQGITQYVILLHKLSQERAITLDQPRVTPGLIRSVARDSLNLSRPVINTIKAGNKEFLRRMPDVELPDGYEAVPFLRGDRIARERKKESERAEAAAVDSALPRRAASNPAAKAPAMRSTAATAAQATPAIGHGEPLPDVIRTAISRGEDPSDVLVRLGLAGDGLWDRVVGPDAVAALRRQG
jgi:hypothetical protein